MPFTTGYFWLCVIVVVIVIWLILEATDKINLLVASLF